MNASKPWVRWVSPALYLFTGLSVLVSLPLQFQRPDLVTISAAIVLILVSLYGAVRYVRKEQVPLQAVAGVVAVALLAVVLVRLAVRVIIY